VAWTSGLWRSERLGERRHACAAGARRAVLRTQRDKQRRAAASASGGGCAVQASASCLAVAWAQALEQAGPKSAQAAGAAGCDLSPAAVQQAAGKQADAWSRPRKAPAAQQAGSSQQQQQVTGGPCVDEQLGT
jgi:hypothetical protein